MVEKWKTIIGNDEFQVSNLGRVRSKINKHIYATTLRCGYASLKIKNKTYRVHRLVAKAFIKNTDPGKTIVNHIDGKKLNNKFDNLEWSTIKLNNAHAYETGLNKRTTRAVLQLDLYEDKIIQRFESLKEAKEKTGIDDGSICSVCKGKVHKAGGFRWRFADVNPNEHHDEILDISEFVPLQGYPHHMISKKGEIYSIRYKKIMKDQKRDDDYYQISISYNKKKHTFLVHVLVAIHFCKKPDIINNEILEVDHIDGNKTNYHAENLEWVTHSENVLRAKNKSKNRNQKTSKSQVIVER